MEIRKNELAANLARVKAEITEHVLAAGRSSEEVELVAVSKTYPASDILILYELGQRTFGENRVQELEAKMADPLLQGLDINWHLIGSLQTNKAKYVVGQVDLIHSVHSLKLIRELERQCVRKDCEQAILLQVNIAKEASKKGFAKEELDSAVAAVKDCPHLHLRGLMCMAPFFEDPVAAYPVFAACQDEFKHLQVELGADKIKVLSMGMSHDYPQAIKAGATHVRIGSSIFGARDYSR
ncbi:MAG: YggS family pyridoxal phosphate-dependent enzyme [Eubacteriales bacterium]|nr:YggS family pyridoxal phosphate-dependent enzyme [Eubacteriales bacterium]